MVTLEYGRIILLVIEKSLRCWKRFGIHKFALSMPLLQLCSVVCLSFESLHFYLATVYCLFFLSLATRKWQRGIKNSYTIQIFKLDEFALEYQSRSRICWRGIPSEFPQMLELGSVNCCSRANYLAENCVAQLCAYETHITHRGLKRQKSFYQRQTLGIQGKQKIGM